jgi:hypothetical protein
MCHPVFSTKEFVQEFIFYSGVAGVQELPEAPAVEMNRRLVESIYAPVFFKEGVAAADTRNPEVHSATPELRQLLNSSLS